MQKALERIVKWAPAWDRRNSDSGKNYGVHGVELLFAVKGERGAAGFTIYTNWHLPHVVAEFRANGAKYLQPLPADVGYHALTPQYEGQQERPCGLTATGKCYYDGSGLAAYDLFDKFVTEGEEAVWQELERWYEERCK